VLADALSLAVEILWLADALASLTLEMASDRLWDTEVYSLLAALFSLLAELNSLRTLF
jgi:hypothetical protein